MTKDEIIKYWLSSSDRDLTVMESLFDNGHYVWALFVGHLVLEKILKAHYVLLNIECDKDTIDELQSAFRFNDAVIRNMILSCSHAITEASPMMKAIEKEKEREQEMKSNSQRYQESDTSSEDDDEDTEDETDAETEEQEA